MSKGLAHPEGWVQAVARGRALAQLGRDVEAVEHFRQAAGLAPEEAEPRGRMALALARLGRRREARAEAERCMALAPGLAWPALVASVVHSAGGRAREAHREALRAVGLEPEHGAAHRQAAWTSLALNRGKPARLHAERALALEPDAADAHEAMAGVLAAERRWPDAEAALRRALSLGEASPGLSAALARAVEKQGRRQEAVEILHDAARSAPSDARVREKLERTTRAYLGAGVFAAVWLCTKLAQVLASRTGGAGPWPWIILGGLLLALGLVWWERRRRLLRLHPTVRAFHAAERRRLSPPGVVVATVLFLLGILPTLLWSSVLLLGDRSLRPNGPLGWSLFAGLAAITLGSGFVLTRQAFRLRAERRRSRP